MDIEIKNSLTKILSAFLKLKTPDKEKAHQLFVGDIYWFIRYISKRDGETRCQYFNKVYLCGNYSPNEFFFDNAQKMPNILKCLQDSSILYSLKAFFVILGRSYTVSKYDRSDIDTERVKEIISDFESVEFKTNEKPIKSERYNPSEKISEKETVKNNDLVSESDKSDTEKPEKTLEELLEELNSLIGLTAVKSEISNRINLIKMQKKGEEFGAVSFPFSNHLVFMGNPGTGKTTVARLISKIYKALGILTTGQLIEVDRGKLVAGFVGQTATKTQEAIDSAIGGILFIDEAYTLTHAKGENDFGQEAVDTILKAMEDNRDNFIVIVAGYPDLMKEFINSNPGLQSRFKNYIFFEDYKPDELLEIFKFHCKKYSFILEDDADEFLKEYFSQLHTEKKDNFANGREIRNFFENVIQMHANRLNSVIDSVTETEYYTISRDDLEQAMKINRSV